MKQFGLIGKQLSYSFSEDYFSKKFEKLNLINHSYKNFELDSIHQIESLLKDNSSLCGLNVTNPYKTAVIPFLDELDAAAKKVGAINTISFVNNKTVGYNTDIIGFRKSIKPFFEPKHSRALIFGTGGSSKAIAYVLDNLQVPYYFVSRSPKNSNELAYSDLTAETIRPFRFLINCTPVGTFPNIEEELPIPYNGITADHLVNDLVYNPEETILLKRAKVKGAIVVNGLSMLRLQAEASWEIWNK